MNTRDYLDRVYRHCSRGHVELRTNTGQRTWAALGNWTAFGRFVSAAVNAGRHVYHGLATRRDTTSGTAANLYEFPMAWADVDASVDDVRKRLDGFPFRPAFWIGSGLGCHLGWPLKEPLDVSTVEGVSRAASLQRRLAAQLGADDRCTSPAVAPRLPGTKNFKYGVPARIVTVIEEADTALNASELEDYLPAEIVRDNAMTIRSSIPVGQRNDQLYILARSLRARGLVFAAVAAAVRSVNETTCEQPLPEDEIRRLLHYALLQSNRPGFVQQPPRPVVFHGGARS